MVYEYVLYDRWDRERNEFFFHALRANIVLQSQAGEERGGREADDAS